MIQTCEMEIKSRILPVYFYKCLYFPFQNKNNLLHPEQETGLFLCRYNCYLPVVFLEGIPEESK